MSIVSNHYPEQLDQADYGRYLASIEARRAREALAELRGRIQARADAAGDAGRAFDRADFLGQEKAYLDVVSLIDEAIAAYQG